MKRIIDAVIALDPQPRQRRWVSLSLCIADAVWSIGANYDSVVVPLTRNLAATLGVAQPTVPATDPIGVDPLPLTRIVELGIDELTALTNRQRTSALGGILKSEAVLRHARVFVEHGVTTRAQAVDLFTDTSRFDALDTALRSIPGEGADAVRRGYLWMLIGHDDLIKPDRMVLRWLAQHGLDVDPAGASDVIAQLIAPVSQRLGRQATAWEIDHALWSAGRDLPPHGTRRSGQRGT